MASRDTGIFLIATAVFLLTAAQLIIKARLTAHGAVPLELAKALPYVRGLVVDWQMILGGAALVGSSLLWYAAISRLPLSVAYPFAALSFPLVFVGSLVFLREEFNWELLLGNGLIVLGLLLVVRAARG